MKAGVSKVQTDTLVGKELGRTIVADTPNVQVDVLQGQQLGRDVAADAVNVQVDVLQGKQLGRTIVADMNSVIAEALIKIRPLRVQAELVEILASIPNAPVSPTHQVWKVAEQAHQQRDPLPHPSTVWSWTSVAHMRQQAVTWRPVPDVWPRSGIYAGSLRRQVVMDRIPAVPYSWVGVGKLARLALVSRGAVYVPTSGTYVIGQVALALGARPPMTPPAQTWSPLRTHSQVMLVLHSRQAAPAQPTDEYAISVLALAVAARTPAAPYSSALVAATSALAVTRRVVEWPVNAQARQVVQQALARRVPVVEASPEAAGQVVLQALQQRSPSGAIGIEQVRSVKALTLAKRIAPAPGDLGQANASGLRMLLARARPSTPPGAMRDTTATAIRITYTMGRTTVPPIEVIDPTVGRHAKQLAQEIVSFRPTVTPADKLRMQRTVEQLAQQLALVDDTFPAPPTEPQDSEGAVLQVAQELVLIDDYAWLPTSAATVDNLAQQLVVEDGEDWGDPTVPRSDVLVELAGQQLAVVDPDWIDPTTAASDLQVNQLAQQIAAVDGTFPPGGQPQSVLDVLHVSVHAAVVDPSFPPGDTPLSSVSVLQATLATVSRDNSLVGNLPGSPASVLVVAQHLAMRDPSLVGIPSRPRGPRPSVTLTRR